MQQVITAKWTPDELALMDDLMGRTGAQSRSQLLRLALLTLAEDQTAPPTLTRAAQRSRLDHPYRRTNRTVRLSSTKEGTFKKQLVKARKRK